MCTYCNGKSNMDSHRPFLMTAKMTYGTNASKLKEIKTLFYGKFHGITHTANTSFQEATQYTVSAKQRVNFDPCVVITIGGNIHNILYYHTLRPMDCKARVS